MDITHRRTDNVKSSHCRGLGKRCSLPTGLVRGIQG
jgi:hypothetical protein